MLRTTRCTNDAPFSLLTVQRLAQCIGADSRQSLGNISSAQVQLAAAFGRIKDGNKWATHSFYPLLMRSVLFIDAYRNENGVIGTLFIEVVPAVLSEWQTTIPP